MFQNILLWFFGLVLAIGLLTACAHKEEGVEPGFDPAPFEGTWKVTQASLDGINQPEWQEQVLSFKTLEAESGIYSMPLSAYDSIFPKQGDWAIIHTLRFLRSDGANVYYDLNNDGRLVLLIMAEWLLTPYPCDEGPCLPALNGHWLFELKKTE